MNLKDSNKTLILNFSFALFCRTFYFIHKRALEKEKEKSNYCFRRRERDLPWKKKRNERKEHKSIENFEVFSFNFESSKKSLKSKVPRLKIINISFRRSRAIFLFSALVFSFFLLLLARPFFCLFLRSCTHFVGALFLSLKCCVFRATKKKNHPTLSAVIWLGLGAKN